MLSENKTLLVADMSIGKGCWAIVRSKELDHIDIEKCCREKLPGTIAFWSLVLDLKMGS